MKHLVTAGALLLLMGCRAHGSSAYSPEVNAKAVVGFVSTSCSVPSGLGGLVQDSRLRMVHGVRGFSFLVLQADGTGMEVENHWQDSSGHHFGAWLGKKAWVYTVPDRRGAPGRLDFLTDFRLAEGNEHTVITGPIVASCELKATALREQDRGASVCTPGATQECVGAGACRGGQGCRADGSGFDACDCGGPGQMEEEGPGPELDPRTAPMKGNPGTGPEAKDTP